MNKSTKHIGYVITVALSAVIIFGLAFLFRDSDNGTGRIFAIADVQSDAGSEVECEHTFKSESGNFCTKCGYEYVPQITELNETRYAVKDGVPVRSDYYQGDNEVEYLLKGDAVHVIGTLTNSVGSVWYVTEDNFYIFTGNLE